MYKGLDIGTAKLSHEEREEINHHFIDVLDPAEPYNAGQYEREVEQLLQQLFQEYQLVLVVGGSTLYFRALWEGMDDMPAIPAEIRSEIQSAIAQNGLASLLEELKEVDPETYASIDKQNPARVSRAIEVFRASAKPISSYRKQQKKKNTPYTHVKLGLSPHRELLYSRIDQRVIEMIHAGLVKEVQNLLDHYSPDAPGLQSIGYKELIDHLKGELSLEEAISLIQRNSRRYAKRQLTYFRRFEDIVWFDPTEEVAFEKIKESIASRLQS